MVLGAVSADVFPDIFSYVALGHLHRPQTPDNHVCYSGSPIALSFSEANDTKEVQILDFADGALKTQTPIPVPVFRRLAQIRISWDDRSEAISNFNPDTGKLETWVEVVIKDVGLGEDINEVVQNLAAGRNFKVLKVLRESVVLPESMRIGDQSDDEAIETLLDDPTKVFEHLLEQESNMNEEKKELKIAFAQLLDLYKTEGANT